MEFFVKSASACHLYIACGFDYTTTDENNITGGNLDESE